MTVDPEFPDRPQHPDFWAMVAAVQRHDEAANAEAVLAEAGIDVGSLTYMARQRALRATQLGLVPDSKDDLILTMASVWFDAFLVGLSMGKERAVKQVLEEGSDGNRRGLK